MSDGERRREPSKISSSDRFIGNVGVGLGVERLNLPLDVHVLRVGFVLSVSRSGDWVDMTGIDAPAIPAHVMKFAATSVASEEPHVQEPCEVPLEASTDPCRSGESLAPDLSVLPAATIDNSDLGRQLGECIVGVARSLKQVPDLITSAILSMLSESESDDA